MAKIAKVALSIVALAAILILAGEGVNLLPIAFNDLIARSAYVRVIHQEGLGRTLMSRTGRLICLGGSTAFLAQTLVSN